jgi:xanthine dehydrogenase accessory factor
MSDLYARILDLLDRGEPSVLATIIRLSGSGPRGVGAKILILADGRSEGTIGGGLLEATVVKEAGKVFRSRLPVLLSLSMMGKDVTKTEMLCGGDVEVLLEPVLPEQKSMYEKVLSIQRSGFAGLLATLVNEDLREEGRAPKLVIERGRTVMGSIPSRRLEEILVEETAEFLKKRKPVLVSYREKDGREIHVFVEPIAADPVVYIFGGGHVSSQIVPLANHVGFQVVVVDDRPEFADPGRFPDAHEVVQMDFKGCVGRLPIDKAAYMVIVTRGHAHDKTVLEQCLRSEAGYIGMIGSRRKRALIYDSLLEEGFTKEDLDRVHSPIGIDIGAETPEEIGVSIVAELIKVRAGKEGKRSERLL